MLPVALAFSLVGAAGVYIRLRREFPRAITLTTLALLLGATPLAWYTIFEPSVRDIALFAVVSWLGVAVNHPAAMRVRWLPVAAWVAIAAVPLLIAWPSHVLHSRWSDVLFSSTHGFLSWTPVVYVAVLGTIAYLRRDRAWAIATLVVLFTWAWTIGASSRWMDTPAFGGRFMTGVLGVLAPGLAFALDALRRRPSLALAPVVAVPLLWNDLLMVQYTIGMLPKDEPISFARMVRQQGEAYARGLRFYPFAFPANAWFAWQESVPVDRYDLLATEPRRAAIDVVMDRSAERFFLSGWESPTKDDWGSLWWITSRSASLVVPLVAPHGRDATIVVRARTRLEEPTVQADLGLRINGREVGQFSPSAPMPSEARVVVPASAGDTLWRDGLNHITIVNGGAHRIDPSDTRPPGPLGQRRGSPPWPVAVYRIAINTAAPTALATPQVSGER